jgi:hypothetical protein
MDTLRLETRFNRFDDSLPIYSCAGDFCGWLPGRGAAGSSAERSTVFAAQSGDDSTNAAAGFDLSGAIDGGAVAQPNAGLDFWTPLGGGA